ncbi:MAG: phosphotransferase family protein [Acidimicrobiales bacterium]
MLEIRNMVESDFYPQPDVPDPVLDRELVLELVGSYSQASNPSYEVDETGGEARAYIFDDVVLKVQRPQQVRARTSLEKEALILDQLAKFSSVPAPRVLHYGRYDSIEYEVLSRIRGVALRDSSLVGAARVSLLHDVGATLREFHAMHQTTLVSSGLIAGDQNSRDVVSRLSASLHGVLDMLERNSEFAGSFNFGVVRAKFLDDLSSDAIPVTLHSNPGPEHCFVDAADGSFTGIIDFGDAYRSHPALDVRSWRSLEDSRHILDGYAKSAALTKSFLRIWTAGVLVGQLRLAVHGYASVADVENVVNQLLEP